MKEMKVSKKYSTFTCELSCDKASLYDLMAWSYSRLLVATSAMSQQILK
jgi:hypothetical protein